MQNSTQLLFEKTIRKWYPPEKTRWSVGKALRTFVETRSEEAVVESTMERVKGGTTRRPMSRTRGRGCLEHHGESRDEKA